MKTIWKFPIDPKGVQLVEMPIDSRPFRAGWDPYERKAYIWAECDTRKEKAKYRVFVIGTGESLDNVNGCYLGTVAYSSRSESRMLNWHIYFNPEPVDWEESDDNAGV